ncbi:MAG: hypothetical protein Q4C55_10020 [Eubacterium sp.]|nr:hypothetical protein [Eubacterium sp.]
MKSNAVHALKLALGVRHFMTGCLSGEGFFYVRHEKGSEIVEADPGEKRTLKLNTAAAATDSHFLAALE